MPRDKNILSNGLIMYQEVHLELDLRLGEDILRGHQVGDFHLHLIFLIFKVLLYNTATQIQFF
jgi:hypothetical protein